MQIKLNMLIGVILLSFSSLAQVKDSAADGNRKFWDKFYLMGGFGLSFGDETYINLAPVLAYRFTPQLHGGAGIGYSYYNNLAMRFSTNIYQGSLFGRFFIFENLFAHAEYEEMYLRWSDGKHYTLNNMYVGGGYNQRLGGNSFVSLLILYNLNMSPYSPYPNPIIRAGFGVGL